MVSAVMGSGLAGDADRVGGRAQAVGVVRPGRGVPVVGEEHEAGQLAGVDAGHQDPGDGQRRPRSARCPGPQVPGM